MSEVLDGKGINGGNESMEAAEIKNRKAGQAAAKCSRPPCLIFNNKESAGPSFVGIGKSSAVSVGAFTCKGAGFITLGSKDLPPAGDVFAGGDSAMDKGEKRFPARDLSERISCYL